MPQRREILKFLAVSPWLTGRSVAQPGAPLTELDHIRRAPGYFDSPWPVECGGSTSGQRFFLALDRDRFRQRVHRQRGQ